MATLCLAGTAVRNSAPRIRPRLALPLHRRDGEQEEASVPNGRLLAMVLAVVATGLPITGAVAGEVNVGINIGVAAPRSIVLPATLPVVVVPKSTVSFVRGVN